MRITTVIPELGAGGAEVVAVALARAAADDGHDVTVASGPGFRVDQVRAAGIPHVPVPLVGRSPLGLLRTTSLLRAAGAPELVHAHNPKATLAARLAYGPGVPLLTTLHGVGEGDLPAAVRVLRWSGSQVAVVSPHIARQLTASRFPEERIDVVPNGVTPLPPYPRERARTELGLMPGAVVGLCLGRMVDQKRHDLLLGAWAALRTPAVLLLAGDGPNRPRVVRDVERSGLGGNVRLLGVRSDVPRLVAASDFLVLPTDWEGLPISVLEALSAGLPVVASRVDGLTEHFAGGVRFVEPGSARALAGALREVVTRPSVRAELAASGRAVVADRFDPAAMVARYLQLYERLAGSRRSRLSTTGGRQ